MPLVRFPKTSGALGVARWGALLLAPWCWGGAMVARGEDFRVETEVFVGGAKEPASENLTIFTQGLAYDFQLQPPHAAAVFDLERGRIVVLDPPSRRKAVVVLSDLKAYTEGLLDRAAPNKREFFAPQFERDASEPGWLAFRDGAITYRVKTRQPERAGAAAIYHEFANWSAQLNALRPGSAPPFPRMALNAALLEESAAPEEIQLSIVSKQLLNAKKFEVRSRHHYWWSLSNSDHKRVEQAGEYMANFTLVTYAEFLNADKVSEDKR